MIIYEIAVPYESRYASFDRHGAWEKIDDREGLCEECTGPPREERRCPLILEWARGSDQIGDFTWEVCKEGPVVTKRVYKDLASHFSGFEAGPIVMQEPESKRKTGKPKRRRSCVNLPYEGPELCELWVTARVVWDRQRSTIRQIRNCKTCGRKYYRLEGMESRDYFWNPETLAYESVPIPRKPGCGIIVRESKLAADIFKIPEFLNIVLCTPAVKDFIERAGYTNVAFPEAGETIPD